jgi:tRNA-Thr(GGU) m(6)t(6)A37 methyltransferase TsaA
METVEKSVHSRSQTPSSLTLRPVGVVRSMIKEPSLTASDSGINMQRKMDDVRAEILRMRQQTSEIVINEDLVNNLDGIEEYSHLVVLYWAHRVPEQSRSLSRVHPMGRKEFPLVGIFCTCSPARPNPVLMTVVRLLERKENTLHVTGLDAVDGSPVVDIKPYVKEFYPQQEQFVPEWMKRILLEVEEVMR